MNNPTIEKGISEIVGVFCDPILVFPGGWGDTLPEWLKNAITLERLAMNMKALKGELPTGTDAEACAYLNTASLTQPMDHDWAQIYLYIAGKTYTRWKKTEMPEDIRVDSLNDDQMRDLNRLKAWLYQKRTTVRLDRERAERRQQKEEATAKKEEEQPALFDFQYITNSNIPKGTGAKSRPPFFVDFAPQGTQPLITPKNRLNFDYRASLVVKWGLSHWYTWERPSFSCMGAAQIKRLLLLLHNSP